MKGNQEMRDAYSSIIQKSKIIRKIDRYFRLPKRALGLYRAYFMDANKLLKYYMYGSDKRKNLEYRILMDVHSLEKGMCIRSEKSFGYKKCINLVSQLDIFRKEYSELIETSTAFLMGVAILSKWLQISEERGWGKTDEYLYVKEWVKAHPISTDRVSVGTFVHEFNSDNQTYDSIIKTRATRRLYSERPLSNSDIEACVELSLRTPSACNRQMCKIYSFSNQSNKEKLSSVLTGVTGLDKESTHYFVITYDIPALGGVGERNQGYFNSGLVAMNFVNALHSRGIGSCFLQFDATVKLENQLKMELGIGHDERIAVAIGAGYYSGSSIIPLSQRKGINEVFYTDNLNG